MRLTEKLEQLGRAMRLRRDGTASYGSGSGREAPPCVGCRGVPIDRLDPVEVGDGPGATADTIIGPKPGLQVAAIGDHLVALHPESGQRVLLNATAALIFTAFNQARRVGDVVDQLATETATDPAAITADVLATVDQLVVKSILENVEQEDDDRDDLSDDPVVAESAGVHAAAEDDEWAYDSGPRTVAGITFRIRSASVDLATVLAELLAGFEPSPGPEGDVHTIDLASAGRPTGESGEAAWIVRVDGFDFGTPTNTANVLGPIFDALDKLVVTHAHGLRFHAGAVERGGAVVLIMGQSGQGKSTLTAALTKRGFNYLTDEVVIVDPDELTVTPYARPFDLDPASCERLELDGPALDTGRKKGKVPVAKIGTRSQGGKVDLIVVLTGQGGAKRPVSAATFQRPEALMAMLPLTFGETFQEPEALLHLAAVCEATPIIRLDRGPVHRMARVIEGACGAPMRLADR